MMNCFWLFFIIIIMIQFKCDVRVNGFPFALNYYGRSGWCEDDGYGLTIAGTNNVSPDAMFDWVTENAILLLFSIGIYVLH